MGSNEPDANARREAIARALFERQNDEPDVLWQNVYARRRFYELADAVLATLAEQGEPGEELRSTDDCPACKHPLYNHHEEYGCMTGWKHDHQGIATEDGCRCNLMLARS